MNLMAVAHKPINYFSELHIVVEELVDVIKILRVHDRCVRRTKWFRIGLE
jgi:hypothetical protein